MTIIIHNIHTKKTHKKKVQFQIFNVEVKYERQSQKKRKKNNLV